MGIFIAKVGTMNLKNAAVLLFACAIVSALGDLLSHFERIVEMDVNLQSGCFILIAFLVDSAFLLVGRAFYSASATLQARRSSGTFLVIATSLWVLYYFWLLAERMIDGVLFQMAYDYYLWMFLVLFHSVTSLILAIAIASGNAARLRLAGLMACIGAGIWTAWLLFRFVTSFDYLIRMADEPIDAVKMLMDFALPIAVFFFGMALYRTPVEGVKNHEVIDEL